MRSLLTEEQGLTLAEVLTALGVLSIGLVAMISLLPLAGSSIQEGGHRSGAAFLAAQRLEEIRHTTGLRADAILVPRQPPSLRPTRYSSSRSVRDCGVAPAARVETTGVRQVTVTVTFRRCRAGAVGEPRSAVT